MPSTLTEEEEKELEHYYWLQDLLNSGGLATLSSKVYKRIQELEMKKWNL